jgi:ABC-type uncharacterized transport system auxiliary subunit
VSSLARILVAIAVVGAGGCFRGRLPAIELFRLRGAAAPDSAIAPAVDGAGAAAIAISRYVTLGVYASPGIVYRVEGGSYGAYTTREWAVPLGEELGLLTEDVLRGSGVAGPVVYDPQTIRHFAYAWRGRVREFEEVVRNDSVLVAVSLDAQLVRTADDSVLWSGARRVERPARSADMPGIVATMSEVAADVIASLVQDATSAVGEGMRRAPPATGKRAPE